MNTNVFEEYGNNILIAPNRTCTEIAFEQWCEDDKHPVKHVYKNGDKGDEYFGIVYKKAFRRNHFYPDYIVGTSDGKTWIIETKGGFSRAGDSEDIDKYTAKKFGVLKNYLDRYGLQGGVVRQDKQSSELCICTESYSDDIKSDSWVLLSDIM